MKSIAYMLGELEKLLPDVDTDQEECELNDWEQKFVFDLCKRLKDRGDTVTFSAKQAEWIETLYSRKIQRIPS